jgi:hypothetical protein
MHPDAAVRKNSRRRRVVAEAGAEAAERRRVEAAGRASEEERKGRRSPRSTRLGTRRRARRRAVRFAAAGNLSICRSPALAHAILCGSGPDGANRQRLFCRIVHSIKVFLQTDLEFDRESRSKFRMALSGSQRAG